MIDLKSIEAELNHARAARMDAEAASTDVEDLVWRVQHFEPGRGRLFFFIDGEVELEAGEAVPLAPAN